MNTADPAPFEEMPNEPPLDSGQQPHVDPTEYPPMGLREKLRLMRDSLGEDISRHGLTQKLGLLATAGWLAYEWGPGNETVTPILAGRVIDATQGPTGIAATAAISAGFTFAQQVASGATLAATATRFPAAAAQASELMRDETNPELNLQPWDQLPRKKRFLYAFTMGTTFVATREAGITGDVSFRHSMQRVLGSAVLCAAGVGAIAGSVELMDTYDEYTPPAVEATSTVAVDVITHPLFWLSILGISTYAEHRKRKKLRAASANQD